MAHLEADGLVDSSMRYSVIVPVRDEAERLPWSVSALLAATSGDDAEIIYVCNACTDDSAAIVRSLAGARVRVLESSAPGKVTALNAGDAATDRFPRFYMDADVALPAGAFAQLVRPLLEGSADLVAPRYGFDTTHCSWTARQMAETWLSLPYARTSTFQMVVGLSAEGRRRWGTFVEGPGDDIFMASMIPSNRRKLVLEVSAVTKAPARFSNWVRMRRRWLRGERALRAMGLLLPSPVGQRVALLRRLATPTKAAGAICFIAARLIAAVQSRVSSDSSHEWRPDR